MEKNKQNAEAAGSAARGFLSGLVIGGLTGAGAMLLLAPQSGKRTRAKIQQKSIDLREQASEAVEDAATQIRVKTRQLSADISDQAEELQQRGQALFSEQKNRLAIGGDHRPKAGH
ncbi:MAG: YtxH domain-containing protein [Anaerolineales bacterium]|nr:YtxH domain-containing protein [Anaerolineales bacterium]